MMDDLEKQGWPVNPDDISLLEKEIQEAQTFLLQSQDLRQKSEQVKTITPSNVVKIYKHRHVVETLA